MTRTLTVLCLLSASLAAQSDSTDKPRWWAKYQYLLANGPSLAGNYLPLVVGANVDASDECGPQSETYISINTLQPSVLAGGSNEIFRLPMRGYFSADGGATWGGVDLPLPPTRGTNNITFGSDPSLAFDTRGNVFYSYITVSFSAGNGINGTGLAVARSSDGGRTYPSVAYFSVEGGQNHFNDKPMITADTNPGSPFRDRVYVAWDAASGGSTAGGIRVAASADQGATFSITRADDPSGPGRSIGAVPFVGPSGQLYVSWNDYAANAIVFNRSMDGGATWGVPRTVSNKTAPFQINAPAISFRGALVYPACDADRSAGVHRGRLYCSWLDLNAAGTADIFLSYSDDQGDHWSPAQPVADRLSKPADRFNHWLAVDAVTGAVGVSFYDTRNDTTGSRYMTDIYFTHSTDGGATWFSPNLRVTTASSNEHDCNGVLPCTGINYGNQYGDYEGLAGYGGVWRPIWTDSRRQLVTAPGCRTGLAMEEVFTARIQ